MSSPCQNIQNFQESPRNDEVMMISVLSRIFGVLLQFAVPNIRISVRCQQCFFKQNSAEKWVFFSIFRREAAKYFFSTFRREAANFFSTFACLSQFFSTFRYFSTLLRKNIFFSTFSALFAAKRRFSPHLF